MKHRFRYILIPYTLSLVCIAFSAKDPDWILKFDGKNVNPKSIAKTVKKTPLASDIYLTNGEIDVFPSELFALERLRLLMLGNIQIQNKQKFNKDLCSCEKIGTIQLVASNLTTLNIADSCKLLYLRTLSISDTKLNQLKIRPYNPTLKYLTLFNTDLSALPEKFETIDHLYSLTIGMNKKMDIKAELPKLKTQKRIKTIALSYSNLAEFPDVLFQLKTLEEIQLHGNNITEFDDRLQSLPNLKKLKLTQNKSPLSQQFLDACATKLPNCELTF